MKDIKITQKTTLNKRNIFNQKIRFLHANLLMFKIFQFYKCH